MSDSLIVLGGRAVEGTLLLDTFDRNDNRERYVKFRDSLQKKFKVEPNQASVASYDAATTLFAALQASLDNGLDLKSVLLSPAGYPGLQQLIKFDAFGDSGRDTTVILVRNGQFSKP